LYAHATPNHPRPRTWQAQLRRRDLRDNNTGIPVVLNDIQVDLHGFSQAEVIPKDVWTEQSVLGQTDVGLAVHWYGLKVSTYETYLHKTHYGMVPGEKNVLIYTMRYDSEWYSICLGETTSSGTVTRAFLTTCRPFQILFLVHSSRAAV
jgi:hypothetical protein